MSSLVFNAHAQMMGIDNSGQELSTTPAATPTQQDLQDIQTGQDLYNKLQNKQVSCNNLQDSDFEKIGEYIMNQQFGNTNSHIQTNDRLKQMMGDQGEVRIHTAIGKSVSECDTNNQQGGVHSMMNGYPDMMGTSWGYGFGFLWLIGYIFVLIDLILTGIWLWKQVKKK